MKIQVFILALFLSLKTWSFTPYEAHYQLSINGIKIAEEVRTLHQLKDAFFYTANAKTSGLASIIKDYSVSASSTFVINENGVDGLNYQIMEQSGKEIENYAIDIHSKNKTVSSILTKTRPNVVIWKTEGGNIVDPLNLFLAVSFDLKAHPQNSDFHYQVANGKSIEKHHYQKTKAGDVNPDLQEKNTVAIMRIGDNNNKIEAYFLSDYEFIPALILRTNGSKEYVYQLKRLKFTDKSQLQVVF